MIDGAGVRLRNYRLEDLDDLVTAFGDDALQRFMPLLPRPFTRAQGEWYIREVAADAFTQGGSAYAIADPDTDRILGGISVNAVQASRGQGEIGYWVGPWARRRGIATAAVRALSEHAFAHGFARLELLTHWENPASQRVALAAGYRREGVRRGVLPGRGGGHDDLIAYARIATDPGEPIPRVLPDLPGGELTDGVVTLLPLTSDYLKFYTELHEQPDVIATSVPPARRSDEEMQRRCARAEAGWVNGDRMDLIVADTATGEPAGEIALFYQEPSLQQAMIGYSMMPAWRGRGYMTRAAQLVALWAFAETGIARIVAGALPTNVGSQRVLEKAGFAREAYMRSRLPAPDGKRSDDVQFVLLPEDVVRQAVDSSDKMP
jgi:RimJ/RimL family protein N-acetyltransferase